jgi:hypothetical protein
MPFHISKKGSFYQDRLGTSIGKALKKEMHAAGMILLAVEEVPVEGKSLAEVKESLSPFPVCLSRACLGKALFFSICKLNNTLFRAVWCR